MTAKDKKLLIFLMVFVVLVAFLWLVLLPKLDLISAQSAELSEVSAAKEEIQLHAAGLEQVKDKLESNQGELVDLTANFYPVMRTTEIDRLLTGMILEQGLEPKDLNISPVSAPATLSEYVGSLAESKREEIGQEAEPGEVAKQSDAAAVSEEALLKSEESQNTVGETLTETEAEDAKDKEEVESTALDLIYQSEISMTVNGVWEDMQALVDALFAVEAIHVTHWQYAATGTDVVDGSSSMQIHLTVYMCEKTTMD